MRIPGQLFPGVTVNVVTEVIGLRESKSRPDAWIITFFHQAFNQHGDVVATCKRAGLQRKMPLVTKDFSKGAMALTGSACP